MNINPNIVPFLDAGIFPAMQSSGSYMNPQKIVQSETRSTAKASIPSYNTIDAWSPQQSPWPSNAAPTTSTPFNSMKQFQGFGQMAAWGTEPVPDSYLDDDWFQPESELFDRYPEEDVLADTRYATASAPPQSSVDAGYSQQSTWSNNVAPPTSTQYNTMEQFQDYGQMAACSADSVPCMDSNLFSTMQPSNFYMIQQNVVSVTASVPIHSSFVPGWPKQSTWPSNVATSTFNPVMQPSDRCMNPPDVVSFETRYVTASAPPCSSVDTGYSQPSISCSDVAPPTSTQYNTMEQILAFAQMMAARSVVSSLEARVMRSGLFPGMQPFGSYMNPQEVVPTETRCAVTTSAPPKWPQPVAPSSNTTPPTFTQKPMEQFQNNRQTKLSSSTSAFQGFMVPSSSYMHPPEVVESETSHVARVEQDKKLDPGNVERKKWQRYDERTVSILRKHYLEDPYLAAAKKMDLANQTGLTPMQIADWFAGRRRKERKAEKTPKKKYHNKLTVSTLRKHYLQGPYLSLTRKKELAKQTGLTPKQVNRWFINRRRSDWVAEAKKIEQNGNVIDRHSVESAPSKDSESVDFSSQMIAPEDLQMPMQLQMAPTHDQTGVMQNQPKPLSPTIYDYSINDVKE